MMVGALQKMVLVITSATSNEVLERWTFDLQTDRAAVAGGCVSIAGTRLSVMKAGRH